MDAKAWVTRVLLLLTMLCFSLICGILGAFAGILQVLRPPLSGPNMLHTIRWGAAVAIVGACLMVVAFLKVNKRFAWRVILVGCLAIAFAAAVSMWWVVVNALG